jgi:hypothetical protein
VVAVAMTLKARPFLDSEQMWRLETQKRSRAQMSIQDVETEDGEEDLFGFERERGIENGSPKKALRIDHAM